VVDAEAHSAESQPPLVLQTFDDTEGPKDETETFWPTVSSPEDYAWHTIRLRVHSPSRYTVIGSGSARRSETGAGQAWTIDTGVPVASHTVFFAAVPSRDVDIRRFDARGVDVTIVSDQGPQTIERAAIRTRQTIA